jgi:hypothetical protein
MTAVQFLSLLMMPAAGLIIGLVGLYVTRHTREHTQPGE